MNKYIYFVTSLLIIELAEVFLEGSFIITPIYLLIAVMIFSIDHLLRDSGRKSKVIMTIIEYSLLFLILIHGIGVTVIYTSFITTQREASVLLTVDSILLLSVILWTFINKRKEKNQL